MSKDPAVLFYIDNWLTSTAEMDADCRGWYLNLVLHNYDKGSLPSNIEKLATLCNVKFSEFHRFEQVFKQVLQHLFEQVFEQNNEQRISNVGISSLIKSRQDFKDKRSDAGKLSYLMRFFYKNYPIEVTNDESLKDFIKKNIDLSIDTKNEQTIKQVFKHLLELYINRDINRNNNINNSFEKSEKLFKKPTLEEIEKYCLERNNQIEPSVFFDFYQSKGWMIGKNQMKDWKACIRTWEKPKTKDSLKNAGETSKRKFSINQ